MLGAILNKYRKLGGLGYDRYTTMYNAGVCPILDYAANMWGYKEYLKINIIQNSFDGRAQFCTKFVDNRKFGIHSK